MYKSGKLRFHDICQKHEEYGEFQSLMDVCYAKEWVPYCKKTFKNAYSVIEYIGRYTHRIAISNNRIQSIDKETVTYLVQDYRNQGKWKRETVSGVEFIRRFLMHVLPKGFVRLRHYGLLCNRYKKDNLTKCRNQIGCKKYISALKGMNSEQMLKHLYGIDLHVCPECDSKRYAPFKEHEAEYYKRGA